MAESTVAPNAPAPEAVYTLPPDGRIAEIASRGKAYLRHGQAVGVPGAEPRDDVLGDDYAALAEMQQRQCTDDIWNMYDIGEFLVNAARRRAERPSTAIKSVLDAACRAFDYTRADLAAALRFAERLDAEQVEVLVGAVDCKGRGLPWRHLRPLLGKRVDPDCFHELLDETLDCGYNAKELAAAIRRRISPPKPAEPEAVGEDVAPAKLAGAADRLGEVARTARPLLAKVLRDPADPDSDIDRPVSDSVTPEQLKAASKNLQLAELLEVDLRRHRTELSRSLAEAARRAGILIPAYLKYAVEHSVREAEGTSKTGRPPGGRGRLGKAVAPASPATGRLGAAASGLSNRPVSAPAGDDVPAGRTSATPAPPAGLPAPTSVGYRPPVRRASLRPMGVAPPPA